MVPILDALVNTEGGDYLDTGCGQALISDGIKRNLPVRVTKDPWTMVGFQKGSDPESFQNPQRLIVPGSLTQATFGGAPFWPVYQIFMFSDWIHSAL